ncbi:hypothetical protein F2P81_009986 [Scophthalmus maximus]|uniref:Uncharacterized protein n=1 Tax=Scophthalmus maximus TaxID=52904 RepID=A0A6A4T4K8_SCOMX|nr:hypothetical protein F2P81_009986 [Scophthalmus maximus]
MTDLFSPRTGNIWLLRLQLNKTTSPPSVCSRLVEIMSSTKRRARDFCIMDGFVTLWAEEALQRTPQCVFVDVARRDVLCLPDVQPAHERTRVEH